jgi:two-component system LytT family response regulator
MIKTILIDDEDHCLDTLSILLRDHCPEVQVMERCLTAKSGLESIHKLKPDLVFLDIEMPFMNGFELLQQVKEISFAVIFVTGYDQYAIKAIHVSALDYILKPIDRNDLIAAIRKLHVAHPPLDEQFKLLLQQMNRKDSAFTKIAIPSVEGYELMLVEQIMFCVADDNYTHLHLKNKKKITASRTLKEIGFQLESFPSFVRVHHSYIVNLNEVVRYSRGEGGHLLMSDGSTINVSRSRKEALLKHFERPQP